MFLLLAFFCLNPGTAARNGRVRSSHRSFARRPSVGKPWNSGGNSDFIFSVFSFIFVYSAALMTFLQLNNTIK